MTIGEIRAHKQRVDKLLLLSVSPTWKAEMSPERELQRLCAVAISAHESGRGFEAAVEELERFVESVRGGSDPVRSRGA